MEDDTYRNTEFCQHYRDWAQALKRNYEALKAEQSTVSPARDLSTSTRTAQVDPQQSVVTAHRQWPLVLRIVGRLPQTAGV
jgi:hypothetical protein